MIFEKKPYYRMQEIEKEINRAFITGILLGLSAGATITFILLVKLLRG